MKRGGECGGRRLGGVSCEWLAEVPGGFLDSGDWIFGDCGLRSEISEAEGESIGAVGEKNLSVLNFASR